MGMTDIDMEELEAYLEDSLPEQENIRFEKKMQNNTALKEAYKNRLKTKQLWTEAQEFAEEKEKFKLILSNENTNNRQLLWQTIAAAAVLILMIGSYFYISQKEIGMSAPQIANQKEEMNTLSIDEPISYAKQETYLSVLLMQPKSNQEISQAQTILFKWEGLSSADSLMVFNATNDDLVFKQLLKSKDSILILPAHKLNEGLYYWQISNKKETFIITK